MRIRLGPCFTKQSDELKRLIDFNFQEVQRKLQATSTEDPGTEMGKERKRGEEIREDLSDEEIAIQVEKEILRHGGWIECNLLYVCNPGLRKLIGERKLLQFLKANSSVFFLGKSDSGQDIVGTWRLAASEPVSTQGQTLVAATALGRQATRDLEEAIADFCAAWVPKTAAHDAPFIPRVARDGRVYKKLQAFVRHCPVPSLAATKATKATKAAVEAVEASTETETTETTETWIMELLHLRLFLLDRPSIFVVTDSENPCTKGLKNCCCHLKVALSKEATLTKGGKEKKDIKSAGKNPGKSKEKPAKCTVDVASLQQLFCNGDVFVIDKPADLSSQILQRTYQKMADEEGRGRQIHCFLEENHGKPIDSIDLRLFGSK